MLRRVPLLIGVSLAVVFLVGLATPQGVAVWLFYLIPLLGTFWWPRRGASWIVAGACAVLTVLGLIWSPPGMAISLAITNRLLGISVMGMTALLIDRMKRIEADRRKSNARLRRVIDSNMVGMVFWDREGNIADGNDAFLQTVGYDREDLRSGRIDWRKLTPPEFCERDDQALREIAATGVCQTFEKEYWHKDGHRVPIVVAAASFEEDRTRGVAFILDNSKFKRLERQLAARERRLQTILDSEPECVKIMAADGTLLEMNRAGLEMLDADSAGQLCGQCVDSLVTPEFRPAFQALTERVFRGESGTLEFEAIGLKGHHRWLETHATPLRDDAGQVLSLLSVTRDITEHKQAEAALREAHDQLSKIVATTPGIVCSYRLRPDGSSCLPFGAERIEELCGIPPGTLAEDATALFRRSHPDDLERWRETVTESARTLKTWRHEWRMRHPVRGEIWLEGHSVPLREPDGTIVWMGIVTDITDRKRVEDALQTSEAQLTADLDAMTHLQKVGTLFVEQTDLQPALDEVLAAAIAITDADMGNVQLLDAQSRCLHIVAQRGFEKPFLEFWNTVQEGEGTCGTALRNEDRVLIEDVTQSPIFAGKPALDVLLEAGVRAVQSTLLRSRSGRVLGVFSTHFRTPRRPDERALRLLDLLARQTADILERTEAEQALREADQRLRRAVSAANVGLWDWDLKTNQVYFSPEWKRQIGYEEHEIRNDFSEWQSRVHPDDLERTLDTVRRYLASPWPNYVTEFRLRHKDGSYRWILTQASLQFGDDGRPVRMLGSHVDITDRNLTEMALREREQQLRLFVEHSPAAIAMLDCDMRYLVASQRWLADYRLGNESIVGRSHYELFPDIPEHWIAIHRRCLAGAIEKCEEDPFPREDGTIDWVRWEIRPWYTAQGEVGGLIIFSELITERKRAEARLIESQQRLTLATESAHIGIWDWDVVANKLTWDTAMYELYGIAPQDFGGAYETWEKGLHPEDRDRAVADANAALEGTKDYHCEFRVVWPNGEVRHIEAHAVVQRADDGTALRMLGTNWDITERKQAEEKLRQSDEFNRRIVESSYDCIKVLDLEGNLLSMSEGGQRLLGITDITPYLNQCWIDFWKESDRPEVREAVAAGRAGNIGHFQAFCPSVTGEPRWWDVIISAIRDATGQPRQLLSISRDITERKQAEIALRERDERHRQLFDFSPDALFLVDATGRFLDVNRTAVARYGYSRDELLQLSVRELAAPDLRDQTAARLQAALKLGGQFEWRHRRKDGSEFPVEIATQTLTLKGQPVVLSCVRDISERKEAEAQLRESERRFSTIFRASPVGKCITRFGDGVFLDVNAAFAKITGHTREELLGHSSLDLNFWLDPEDRVKLVQALADNGFVRDWEVRFRRKDGSIGHSLRSLERLTLDGEDCILTALSDITERKQMEQELQDSAASLAAAEERARLGSWELDLATQTGWWSHGMFRLFDRDAALGPPTFTEFLDFVHPDDRQQVIASHNSLIESGQNGTGEFRVNPLHGAPRHFSYSVHCLRDEQGRTVRLAGTLQDITERKRADDELAESRNRLEVLSRQLITTQESERRHLARELHDEIGQALTGVKLHLKSLQQPAQAQPVGSLVKDTIAVVDQTLQQVRNLALDLRPSMLDDIGLVAGLRWCLNRQSQRAGFAPHFVGDAYGGGASQEIETACFRIVQESLTNIARHANASNVRVELRQLESELELFVRDDGVGFDVPAARSRATHGASIGLLGMSERAELLGGQFEIESIPSQGTTIHARIPLMGRQNDVRP